MRFDWLVLQNDAVVQRVSLSFAHLDILDAFLPTRPLVYLSTCQLVYSSTCPLVYISFITFFRFLIFTPPRLVLFRLSG